MSRPDWSREGRDWPHRDASSFVAAGGLRWHVQTMGPNDERAPVALLLHGTGAATHSWRGLMPLLAERWTVIAIDLPGHGFTSDPGPRGYTLPAIAHGVAVLMQTLDVTPAIVIGHSAGAAIAVRMMLDAASATPVIAINGALLPFPGAARLIFPAMARAMFLNPFTPRFFALQGQSKRFVRSFLERSTGSAIDAEGAALYQALFARSGHIAGALGMMANWDLDALNDDLSKLQSPLLLLACDKDEAVPPSVADRVARIGPNATALHLPGLGHLGHEEAPEKVAAAILAFARDHAILPEKTKGGGDDRS